MTGTYDLQTFSGLKNIIKISYLQGSIKSVIECVLPIYLNIAQTFFIIQYLPKKTKRKAILRSRDKYCTGNIQIRAIKSQFLSILIHAELRSFQSFHLFFEFHQKAFLSLELLSLETREQHRKTEASISFSPLLYLPLIFFLYRADWIFTYENSAKMQSNVCI